MCYSDPNTHVENIDNKILYTLERISQAFRVLMWNTAKENALSPIQLRIVLFIKYHDQDKCKVSYLANEFNMTKATISDAVKSLMKKAFVRKKSCSDDGRSYYLELTEAGKVVSNRAANFANILEQSVNQVAPEQKGHLLQSLFTIIQNLADNDVIKVQRMCGNCQHYSHSDEHETGHFCMLLKQDLRNVDIRVDCLNHELVKN